MNSRLLFVPAILAASIILVTCSSPSTPSGQSAGGAAQPTATPSGAGSQAAASTPSAEATRPPRVADSTPYHIESSRNGFGFDYPAGWKLVGNNAASADGTNGTIEQLAVGAPDGPAVVASVNRLTRDVTGVKLTDLKTELDNVLSQAAQQVGGKNLTAKPFRAGSVEGLEYHLDLTSNGKALESRQMHFFSGDRQYSVLMDADSAGQAKFGPDLERIVASFEAPTLGVHGERVMFAVAAAGHTQDGMPDRPGPYFPSGVRAFEVVYAIEGAKDGETVVGSWFAQTVQGTEPGKKMFESTAQTTAGLYRGFFGLAHATQFAPGDYLMQIRLDDKVLRSVRIRVVQ